MKKILTLLAVVILLALPACQAKPEVLEIVSPAYSYPVDVPIQESYPVEDAVQPSETVEQISIDYAANFTLEYKEGYKLLTVLTPWAGATESIQYALVPKGQPEPGGIGDAMIVRTPVESFVSLSTTYLPFLEQIGALESLVAVDSGAYIYNPDVQNWLQAGTIAEVGSGAMINVERLIDLDPDLIMTYASGFTDYASHP